MKKVWRRGLSLSTFWLSTTRQTRCVSIGLTLLVVILSGSPALGWMPPPEDEGGTHADIDRWPSWEYHPNAHVYIIEHAATILANDGYENWADISLQHLQNLANGVMLADRAGDDIKLYWWVDVLWLFTVYEDSMRLCNSASLDHFYNPDTIQKGLDLTGWNDLEKVGNHGKLICLFITTLAGVPGLVDVSADVRPNFPKFARSAADVCVEKYTSAIQASSKGSYADGFLDLGWACHFVGDVAIVQHTYDSWITHESYEEFAEGRGNEPKYHAKSAKPYNTPFAQYPENLYDYFFKANKSVRDLVVLTADKVHSIEHFKWAEGENATPGGLWNELGRWLAEDGGKADHDKVLMIDLPFAERHTAALLAKFMKDTGIPEKIPPLIGTVWEANKKPVPGAYVFYCTKNGEWDYVQTDHAGKFCLSLPPNIEHVIRPVMPGYTYRINGRYVYNTDAGPVVVNLTPNSWDHYTQKGGRTSNTADLILEPLPMSQTASVKEAATVGRPAATAIEKLPPGVSMADLPMIQVVDEQTARAAVPTLGNVKARLQMRQPPVETKPVHIVQAYTPLPISNTNLSLVLADQVNNGLLEIRELRRGLTWPAVGKPFLGEPLKSNILQALPPMMDDSAHYPYVQLQVYHLAGLQSGQILQNSSQIVTEIDKTRASWQPGSPLPATLIQAVESGQSQSSMTMNNTADPDGPAAKAFKLIADRLPKTQITGADGKPRNLVRLPSRSDVHSRGSSLRANGLVLVPAPARVKIEVKIVPGTGYLRSSSSKPLVLTTDSTGRAACQLIPGGYPGKLRLLIKVVKDDEASYLPQTNLDFFIYPYGPADFADCKLPTLWEAPVVDAPEDESSIKLAQAAILKGKDLTVLQEKGLKDVLQIDPIVLLERGPSKQPSGQEPAVTPGRPQVGRRERGRVRAENFESEPLPGWLFIGDAKVTADGTAGRVLKTNGWAAGVWQAAGLLTDMTLRLRYRHADGIGDIALRGKPTDPIEYIYHVGLANDRIIWVREEHQKPQELKSAAHTFRPGQWYNLSIQLTGGKIQVAVDGNTVLTAEDANPLAAGLVGFGSLAGNGFAYDEVSLRPMGAAVPVERVPGSVEQPSVDVKSPRVPTKQDTGTDRLTGTKAENFESEPLPGWLFIGDAKVTVDGTAGRVLKTNGWAAGVWQAAGLLTDMTLRLRYRHADGIGDIALRGKPTDPIEYIYHVGLANDRIIWVREEHQKPQELKSAAHTFRPGQWYNLSIQLTGGKIQVAVDGKTVLAAEDANPLAAGLVGFGSLAGNGFAYDEISLTRGETPQKVDIVPKTPEKADLEELLRKILSRPEAPPE